MYYVRMTTLGGKSSQHRGPKQRRTLAPLLAVQLFSSSCTNPFFFLPNFLSPHPCTEHVPATIKNDQVGVRTCPKCSFSILDAEAPCRIESHAFYRFAQ